MSADIGSDATGLDRTLSGHYPIGMLHIGPSPSTVRLVDTHDNDGLGQSACEAIYVDSLRIDAGSRLINASCKIYSNTLINNGTIDVPANVILLVPSCRADFNGDGTLDPDDLADYIGAFFAVPAGAGSDFNNDGTTDPDDLADYIGAFFSGC